MFLIHTKKSSKRRAEKKMVNCRTWKFFMNRFFELIFEFFYSNNSVKNNKRVKKSCNFFQVFPKFEKI